MKQDEADNQVKKKSFQEEKLELVRLRISNGFYNKSDVLESVVENLLRDGLAKKSAGTKAK